MGRGGGGRLRAEGLRNLVLEFAFIVGLNVGLTGSVWSSSIGLIFTKHIEGLSTLDGFFLRLFNRFIRFYFLIWFFRLNVFRFFQFNRFFSFFHTPIF